jgi:hypothetical protein
MVFLALAFIDNLADSKKKKFVGGMRPKTLDRHADG